MKCFIFVYSSGRPARCGGVDNTGHEYITKSRCLVNFHLLQQPSKRETKTVSS
ncbi:hypothetical protein HanIR_Chr01g0010981 [Helianthus annuus]|nr:hypothetical protein HanIR_Chr01g0010981 [Helianthus annuus]